MCHRSIISHPNQDLIPRMSTPSMGTSPLISGIRPPIPSQGPTPTKPAKSDEYSSGDIFTHLFADVSSTKQLLEAYRSWSVKCGPIRILHECVEGILLWRHPPNTCLLFLAALHITLHPHVALPFLACLLIAGSCYMRLLLRNHIVDLKEPVFEDVNANLEFNETSMRRWCRFYDQLVAMDPVQFLKKAMNVMIAGAAALLFIPIHLVLFLTMAGLIYLHFPCDFMSVKHPDEGRGEQTDERVFEVYENQRWWLGNWSDKALSLGMSQTHPWSDQSGRRIVHKNDAQLPSAGWEWECDWKVDQIGWEYAMGFGAEENEFHPTQLPTDFVRRRRWSRRCSRIKTFSTRQS